MSVKRSKLAVHQSSSAGLLRSLRPILGPLILFSFMTNLLIGTAPLFMLQVVDRVLPTGSISTLTALMAIAFIALLVMAALDYLRNVMMSRAAAWWERDTSSKLLPFATGRKHTASKISSNISSVGTFLSGPPLQAILDAPWAILFFALVYFVHPLLAAVGLSIAILLILIAALGHILGKSAMQEAAFSRMQSNGLVAHLDHNRKLLSTMGIASNLMGLQKELLAESHHSRKASLEPDLARRAMAKFLRASMQILVLGTGAWLVLKGELSGGAMIASSILLARALAPIEQMTGVLSSFVETRMAFRQLSEVAKAPPVTNDRTAMPEIAGEIACENVTVTSDPSQPPTLNQVNLRFPKGECTAIMGSSGAGKTTLAELLAGATAPTVGAVKIDNIDLQRWPAKQKAETIGFLPQDPTLFPGTIEENIARFHPDAEQDEVIQAAVAAGAHAMISRFPEGYATRISAEAGRLSGGEQQRIALARALFRGPKVLVLDEPNAALDKEGEQALISAMSHLKTMGMTIIMVAHRAGVLSLADKILLLDSGRVRDFGPKGEVIARMNARRMQIDLERQPTEIPRLEDWVTSHFKRDSDTEARSNAAMVATEMFNISLASSREQDEAKPIRFILKHRRGMCTISMHDTCELIASARIDRLRCIADDDMILAPVLEGSDLALLMIMQLSESFDQKPADYGRVMHAEVATPIQDGDEEHGVTVLN